MEDIIQWLILNILVDPVSKGPKSPELVEVVASGCNCMFCYRLFKSVSLSIENASNLRLYEKRLLQG